jgi:hypothetical protein
MIQHEQIRKQTAKQNLDLSKEANSVAVRLFLTDLVDN